MNNKHNLLASLLDQAYMEVIPTRTILDRLVHIPQQSYVSITCSSVSGLEPTLQLVEKLRALPHERRLKLIPHIAARLIRDKGHLREILARLEAANVESVFIPAGDAPRPAGEYDNSLAVLRDMAEIGHGIEDVGIAAHPEGHPLVDDDELLKLLLAGLEPFLDDGDLDIRGFHLFSFNDIERTERWRTESRTKFNGERHA